MCSTTSGQLARICRAIEELADRSGTGGSTVAETGAETGEAAAAGPGDTWTQDDLAARLVRLAAIWAMIADADPELARRLPGYLADPD
jgi:hypothetical protein